MLATQKSLDDILTEVRRAIVRLNSDQEPFALPRYTSYDGLQVIERGGPDLQRKLDGHSNRGAE